MADVAARFARPLGGLSTEEIDATAAKGNAFVVWFSMSWGQKRSRFSEIEYMPDTSRSRLSARAKMLLIHAVRSVRRRGHIGAAMGVREKHALPVSAWQYAEAMTSASWMNGAE